MDYKQKYLKYKQKYLNLLRDQKGGEPFLMDILAGQVFSYLFERNQRLLQLIYTNRQPVMIQPLENFTLNHRYRLQLLGRSSISVLLATRLAQGEIRNIRLELHLANRIISRTHKLPKISQPTLAITLDISYGGHILSINSVAFHPTLPFLATGSSDNTAKLWRLVHTSDGSISTAICTATLEGHFNWVSSVAFHPTLPLLATVSGDQTAKLWRFSPNGSVATSTFLLGHSDSLYSVAFHATAPLLATVSGDNTVKLWRLTFDKSFATCVATLDSNKGGHGNYVFSVAFHPTLYLLATGSADNTAKMWRFSTDGSAATCLATLDGHNSSVYSVAFHPTLPLLATGSGDMTAKLWRYTPDGSAATCVATLAGHSDTVGSVAFHPTAPLLATGSTDTTMKLWRYKADGSAENNMQATCMATLDRSNGGHIKWISSVAFHPKAHYLASGSDDNTVKLWRL